MKNLRISSGKVREPKASITSVLSASRNRQICLLFWVCRSQTESAYRYLFIVTFISRYQAYLSVTKLDNFKNLKNQDILLT